MNKVSILLSIYKPDITFLKKQLNSLNNQTYQDLDLIVWNDCPEDETDYIPIFNECITKFPYKMVNEKKNLRYTKAFEKLVTLADGYYVSFCDQDDIWDKDKIKLCVEELEKEDGIFVSCDKSIIDASDFLIKPSVRRSSKNAYETWNTGDNITDRALFFCYATGMTIIAKRTDVLKVIPFPVTAAHDRWLAASLSAMGKPVYVDKPLVMYRRTGTNTTGVLNKISSKQDYYLDRTNNTIVIQTFEKIFPEHKNLPELKKCNNARMNGNIFGLIKYRKLIPDIYKYEIYLSLCPNFLFKAIKKIVF